MAKIQKKKRRKKYGWTIYEQIIGQEYDNTGMAPATQRQIQKLINQLIKNNDQEHLANLISLWKEKEALKWAIDEFEQLIKHLLREQNLLGDESHLTAH